MKKILLSLLAVITAFTSTGLDVFASEINSTKKEIPHTIIDAKGMTIEELQASLGETRGATDLYYEPVSIVRVDNNDYYSHKEVFRKWFDKGANVIARQILIRAAAGSTTAAVLLPVFSTTYCLIQTSDFYNQEKTYYYSYFNATYDIVDALGNFVERKIFTNLKVSSKVEYKYEIS